jgi:ribosomal protein S18 acetylase RimI-like enzyme
MLLVLSFEKARVDSPSKFRIEPAKGRDVGVILRLIRALAEYEKVPDNVTATEASLRESLFGERPFAEAAIAHAGQEPAGMAVFYHTFATFPGRSGLYVEDIIVEEKWRGQGLGKALMAYMANLAVGRGCARLEWSVLKWNESAIGFYRSLGAKPMDQWTVYRLTDEALANLAAEATTD